MGLPLNSFTSSPASSPTSKQRTPQILQQAWQSAQACWQSPLKHPSLAVHRDGPRLVIAPEAFHAHSLWSRLSQSTIHIHWPDFEPEGAQSALRPYLDIALAREIGYFYFTPGHAALAADLQLQARHQLAAHSLSTADAVLQQFLELLVLDKLHQKGFATSRFLHIQQQSPATRLPPWMARLYEYLWRLPTGDLTQALTHPHAQTTPLNDLEESTACLAQLIFHRQRHGHPLEHHLRSQLQQFLNYALHHLQHPVNTPTPLLMLLPKPLGLLIPTERDSLTAHETPDTKAEDLKKDRVDPRGVVRGALSPRQVLERLPEHQSAELLAHYYREAAWPYVYRLTPPTPQAESILEGMETWTLDHPIQQLHWQASLSTSPTLIPGITTRQQVHTFYPAQEMAAHQPPQLTLYLDTSQSMPHPHHEQSLAVLTGFVLMLSALQMQWSVRIITWSEGESDTGPTHNEKKLAQALLQVPQGTTHFPLETLLVEAKSAQQPHEIRVLLSDLGTVESLQQLAVVNPSAIAELNNISLQCLLYLPLPIAYQQSSLSRLQDLLPRWKFQALTHPQIMPQLWGHSHV